MAWTLGGDERAALQFEDLASALDAGLSISSLGGDASAGDGIVAGILTQRGLSLSATETAVLQAAWRSGRIGESLRARALQRRQRAEFHRRIWAGIRYPLVVLGFATVVSFLLTITGGSPTLAYVVAGVLVAGSIGIAVLWRRMCHGGEGWFRLPWIGKLGQDLAEIPYLETLHALYAAGIPLQEANHEAMQTVPFAAVRRRLQAADRALQEGRKLGEGLVEGMALHAETRSLLTTGEGTGQLEDALQRAVVRRRAVAAATAERLARFVGAVLYAIAVAVVVTIVVTFYSNLYGSLGRR